MTFMERCYGRYDTGKKNAKAVAIMNTARKLTNATLKIWVGEEVLCPLQQSSTTSLTCGTSAESSGRPTATERCHQERQASSSSGGSETKRVFCDKLADNTDKKRFLKQLDDCTESAFGKGTVASAGDPLFIDYMRGDEYDEDGVLTAQAPRVYERGGKLDAVRTITQTFWTCTMPKGHDSGWTLCSSTMLSSISFVCPASSEWRVEMRFWLCRRFRKEIDDEASSVHRSSRDLQHHHFEVLLSASLLEDRALPHDRQQAASLGFSQTRT